jgi:hypothetical protein
VSWRDRDYAHLRPDELADLYGVQQPAPAGRAISTRVVVWSLTTIVCVLFFAFALSHRESAPPVPIPTRPLPVYGDALPASSQFGPDAVCTEYQYFRSQGWLCTAAAVNSSHARVYPATPYHGRCAHLRVVDRGWACLDTQPAAPSANS